MERRVFVKNALRAGAALGLGGLGLGACAGLRTEPVADAAAEAAYPPLGRLLQIDGRAVHAVDEGQGPPVVLIHGASANLRDFTFALTERLSRRFRVIAMDRPGFGYSERGPGAWPPARQAAQLRAAARALGAERPIVVGHSWGAAVALAWGLDAPEETAGVVSVSGATMPWGFGADVAGALGIGSLGVRLYTASLSRRAEEGAIEDFVARAFRPQSPPEGYLDYVGAPLSLRARTLEANAEDLSQLHNAVSALAPRYPGFRPPLEILHGEEDWLLEPEQHAAPLAARIPDARLTVAPGVGHMAHHARPALLEAAIARIAERRAG